MLDSVRTAGPSLRSILSSLAVLLLAASVHAQPMMSGGQMPDPKQMSGMPLPVADAPTGSVTVRVIRGQISNILPGQTVELTGAGEPRKITTDQTGHAQFTGLTPGTRVKASVTVTGEKIDSQEFDVPPTGGVRLMLVATDPEAEKKAAADRKLAQGPAIDGAVVIGDQSRFVFEIGDDALNVFNMLPIVNTAKQPVKTSGPLVFELPKDARGVGLLEGNAAQNATAAGRQVIVNGPFAPGTTLLQFAYSLPLGSDSMTISEKMPAPLASFALIAQKTGSMQVSSAQLAEHREATAEGQVYIAGQGRGVKAGDEVSFTFTGLPHKPAWPRNIALLASFAILAAGAWYAVRRPAAPDVGKARKKLQQEQNRLYGELTALERDRRQGRVDADRYASRKEELVRQLEAIYAQLDAEAAA
jgi:hypothetical protein